MPKLLVGYKYFAVAFIWMHLFFLVKNLIYSFDFFNHFSNPWEMLSGLWAVLYVLLHTCCIFLGLCLYVGIKEVDRDLVAAFTLGIGLMTFSSLSYFLVKAILVHLTIFQMTAWTLHILFYCMVLCLGWLLYKGLPKKEGEEDGGRAMEEGQVRVEQQKAPLLDKFMEGLQKEGALGIAAITGILGGRKRRSGNKPGQHRATITKNSGSEGDCSDTS